MAAWLKSVRLPICLLAGLLTIAGFRLGGTPISWLALVAVFFIACSTMLQNDWRDRRHDSHKGKILALQHPRTFLVLLLAFWFVVCVLMFVATIENSKVGAALAAMAFAGLVYSETRRVPMMSIALVALTSGSPAILSVMAGADMNKAWPLFLSATLIVFGREITKDIDDHRIDGGYKWTIPLVIGNKRAKAIAVVTIMVGLAVAVKLSMAVLPASLPATVGVILLVRGAQPKTARICIDVGVALTVLTLIVLS